MLSWVKIYVIRHGLTELNKKKILNGQIDEPLAPEGIEQAKAAISLIPPSITHIYCSSLLRAKQTAEIINTRVLPISVQEEIKEINMGNLAGQSWDGMKSGSELKKKHRSIQFDYRKLGGEAATDVKQRVIKLLKKINNKHENHEVLLVTHGGIIRLLHLLAYGKPLLEEVNHISPEALEIDDVIESASS